MVGPISALPSRMLCAVAGLTGKDGTFGDLNDPNSRVSKAFKSPRTYDLLGELNTKPRLKYLTRITNPVADRAIYVKGGHGHGHGHGDGHGYGHGDGHGHGHGHEDGHGHGEDHGHDHDHHHEPSSGHALATPNESAPNSLRELDS